MEQSEIEDLIERYNRGKCKAEEIALLETWYLKWNHGKPLNLSDDALMQDLLANRKNTLSKVAVTRRTIKIWPRIAVAAVVAAITLSTWLYYSSNLSVHYPEDTRGLLTYANDIAPGKNVAILTLANGKTINLSDAKTGVIIDASKLTYSDGTVVDPSLVDPLSSGVNTKNPDPSKIGLTNLTTPRGGTYQITLPDGSKVWLNADSKITFPSQFYGKERRIFLDGEGYFEVVHNAKQPFRVQSRGQVVEDIGTAFNINGYDDGLAVKTTLVEGSAKVSLSNLTGAKERKGSAPESGSGVVLIQGQQSVVSHSGRINVIEANIEEAVAWKNGYFRFNNETITNIMLQLARWYDIEVKYEGTTEKEGLYGKISRYKNISEALKMLEKTGLVRFKVEGRRVTVLR